MQERALEMDTKHNSQARRLVAQARARVPRRLPQNEIEKRAQEAVTFAHDNALKRKPWPTCVPYGSTRYDEISD